MKKTHYEQYLSGEYELHPSLIEQKEVVEGKLVSRTEKSRVVEIRASIPRFVESENYADNFGLQWNAFRSTQLDSHTGKPFTADRFWKNTKWKPSELTSKMVLEVGSGAGRFTEVLAGTGANIASFDYSNAVDANRANNADKGNVFFFQGDLFHMPVPDDFFDFVFCYGVLQHTPNPKKAFEALVKKLKPGGHISIDIYQKDGKIRPWKSKYLWRPLTTRVSPSRLLKFLRGFIPIWLPFDTAIKIIPFFRNYLGAIIPCWNYHYLPLPRKMKVEWAIMDTFDALGAAYDIPKSLDDVYGWFEKAGFREFEVFEGSNGVVGNGIKEPLK